MKRPYPIASDSAGFTLIELVVVLVLTGILAAVFVPRVVSQQTWATRGYFDAARAALAFARQEAVAQRRWVCVAVAGNALTFSRANRSQDDFASPCTSVQSLPLPGSDSNTLTADSGVSVALLGGAASPLIFNGMGQLVSATGAVLGTVQVQVSGDQSYTMTIEGATGYVH